MDWDDLLGALVSADYQGYFTVETGFGSRDVDPIDVAKTSRSFVRDRLAAIGA
jgi:protein FrlC